MKKTIGIIAACVFAVLAAAGGMFLWMYHTNTYTVEVTLHGGQEICLEYGQPYQEAGASAVVYGSHFKKTPRPVPVTVEGNVDTSKLGIYTLCYRASCPEGENTAGRTVRVTDTEKPVIELISDPEAFTFPGQPYQEEGYRAVDNYDGDLTEQVTAEELDGTVRYRVADSSGNTAEAVRQIRYDDPVAPELTLRGDRTIYLTVGGSFSEPGYSAEDNCDGDLTEKVSVSGSVDTTAPGSYTITYTVSDSYQNSVSVTRQVVVVKPQPPELPEHPSGGVIYLTFDDGPGPYTGKLLDILGKYNVKATFFVMNSSHISEIEREAREGHTVAIHTATHKYSQVYASDEAYFQDLYAMQQIIEEHCGFKSMMLRFPGGSSNTVSKAYSRGIMSRLTKEVERRGFHYYDWNVDSDDAGKARSSDEVFRNVVRGISRHKTSIVLQHDIKGFSVDAVERIIQWGLDNGYTFLPLDESSPGAHHGVNN